MAVVKSGIAPLFSSESPLYEKWYRAQLNAIKHRRSKKQPQKSAARIKPFFIGTEKM